MLANEWAVSVPPLFLGWDWYSVGHWFQNVTRWSRGFRHQRATSLPSVILSVVTKETSETVTSPLRRCESELQTEVTASKIILPVRLSLSWQTSRKRSIETCVCRTETQRELHYCKLKSQAAFFLLASFKPKSVNTNQFYSTETHLRCLLLVHVVWKPVITTCGHRGRCSANATSHRGGGNTTETDVVFWTENITFFFKLIERVFWRFALERVSLSEFVFVLWKWSLIIYLLVKTPESCFHIC